MAQSELTVSLRKDTGKGAARSLRRQGMVPGVVYGKGFDPSPVTVDPKALMAAINTSSGWNTLITLKGDGPFAGKVVILKDVAVHPILRHPIHADFHSFDMNKKIHVMVPVHHVGKSEGEKLGGQLEIIRHELEVYCLPGDIPEKIEIDVESLQIGDSVHVEDISLPGAAEVPHDVNFTILTVTGRMADEEELVEEVEEAESV